MSVEKLRNWDLSFTDLQMTTSYSNTPTSQINFKELIANRPFFVTQSFQSISQKKALIFAEFGVTQGRNPTLGEWEIYGELFQKGYSFYVLIESGLVEVHSIKELQRYFQQVAIPTPECLSKALAKKSLSQDEVFVITADSLNKVEEKVNFYLDFKSIPLSVIDYCKALKDVSIGINIPLNRINEEWNTFPEHVKNLLGHNIKEVSIAYINQALLLELFQSCPNIQSISIATEKALLDLCNSNIRLSAFNSLEVSINFNPSSLASWLKNQPNLKKLSVSHQNSVRNLLHHAPEIKNIETLEVTSYLSDKSPFNYQEFLSDLKDFSQLKKLKINNYGKSKEYLSGFQLQNIEEFHLIDKNISEKELLNLLKSFPNLKKFSFSRMLPKESEEFDIHLNNVLMGLKSLEELSLTNFVFHEKDNVDFFSGIKRLTLTGKTIKHKDSSESFFPNFLCPSLETLTLRNLRLNEKKFVTELKNLPNLKTLNLISTKCSSELITEIHKFYPHIKVNILGKLIPKKVKNTSKEAHETETEPINAVKEFAFSQPDDVSPNTDTIENPNTPQTARQLFEGLDVHDYRIGVYQYDPKAYKLKKIQPSEDLLPQELITTPDPPLGERYPSRFPLKEIKKETWYPLPGGSREDAVHSVTCFASNGKILPDFEISKQDPISKLYYIRFKQNYPEAIVQFKIDTKKENYVASEESKYITITDEDIKKSWRDPSYLQAISDEVKLNGLIQFCLFKSGSLSLKDDAKEQEILEELIEKQVGSCFHRSMVFAAFCEKWNIPCVVPQNDIHAFVEVYINGGWKSIDLGGFRTKLTIENIEPLIPFDTKPFIRPKKTFDSISTCLNEVKKSLNPSAVIMPESQTSLWIRDAQKTLKEDVMVLKPEEIIFESSMINNGKITQTNSELANFLDSKKEVYLVLDLSSFNASHISLYRALGDERKLGQRILPKNVHPIILMPDNVYHKVRGSVQSHFKDTTWHAAGYTSIPLDAHTGFSTEFSETTIKTTQLSSTINTSSYAHHDLYGDQNFVESLVGTYRMNERGIPEAVPGILVNAIVQGKANLTINHPPQTTEFQNWLSKSSVYFNGKTYRIPENFIKIEDTPYDFSDAAYSLHSGIPDTGPTMLELNSGTFEFFFPHQLCDNNTNNLYLKNSFFESHKNQTVQLWITEPMPKNSLAKLLNSAKSHGVNIQFYGSESCLKPLLTTQKSIPPSQGLLITPQLIIANDVDFSWHQYQIENPGAPIPISVHPYMTYDELMGDLQVEKIQNGEEYNFNFTFNFGDVINELINGKNVILKGNFNPHLIAQLSSAFLENPYLLVNGEKVFLKGKLTLIAETPESTLSVSPEKNMHYTKEDFYTVLEKNYPLPKEQLDRIKAAVDELEKNGVYFSYKRLTTVFKTALNYPKQNPFKSVLRLEKNSEFLIECSRKYFERQEKKVRYDVNEERLNKLEKAFKLNHSIFMVGITGVGKSHFVDHVLKSKYELFILDDKNPEKTLLEYLESKSDKPKLLIGDEMNLMHKKIIHQIVSMEGKSLIRGKTYELGKDHYQLLIGNPSTYRGRQSPHFFQKIPAIEFKPLSKGNLHTLIAKPLLGEETDSFWEKYQKKHQDLSKKTPRDVAYKSLRYLVNKEKPRSESEFRSGSHLNELYITPNWEKALKKIQMALDINEYKTKNPIKSGKQGLLIEGESSLKKSFIKALLNKNQIDFVDLTGRRLEEIEGLILNAFHEGKYVLWDDIDTVAPLFERLLNHVMSGTDLEKNPPRKPGFFILGILNSINEYSSGHIPLTDALENRFDKLLVNPDTKNDIKNILMDKGMTEGAAEESANQFIAGKKLDPTLSLQDILPDSSKNLGFRAC